MPVPPFNQYLGIDIERMDGGEAVAVIDLAPHHTNNRGVAHGGVVSSLLDSAMGAAVISAIPKEWWCATTGLSIQFVAGAQAGRLTAKGTVTRKARSVAFVAGEARDASGRLVATAHGTWHLWPFRPEAEKPASEAFIVTQGSGARLRVGKILAVGRNYADHIAEMGNAPRVPPVLFLKPPSALVHDGGVVTLPAGGGQLHHEVELVVVIGKTGRAIAEERASDYVYGYAVGLDLTLRDLQNEAKKKGEPWDLAKGFDGSAPVSLVVPREQVEDVTALTLTLDVNGTRRQSGSVGSMLNDVSGLLAYASKWMTLERGDLLFTGTPAGVGPLIAGDKVVAALSDLVSLRVTIAAGS
jgi:uncharacterized protein (TIGR00369 family)